MTPETPNNAKPKTLESIKRTAKRIKKEQLIAHSHALNVSAQLAGYQNYQHARKQLARGAQ